MLKIPKHARLNFTAGMKAQEDEGDGGILLGDSTRQLVFVVP
jgi:hypothetical protein